MKFLYTPVLIFFLILFSCTKTENVSAPLNNSRAALLETWLQDADFEQITITPGNWSYKDVVFTQNGLGALLDNDNRIFYTYDNGKTWEQKIKINNQTINCIALKPNAEQIFIGGNSLGEAYGAKFWVYDTPKNGTSSLNYQAEAEVSNTRDLINHNFVRASWNGDGSVYASFGRTNYRDGFFGNITPDGRKIFIRRTPSFSRILDREPTRQPSYCAGFYIKNYSDQTTLCTYEYSTSGLTNILAAYYSTIKGSGNSWFNISTNWKAGLVYHIGQDKTGEKSIWVSQANRLFYNGQEAINYKNIQGDLLCATVDQDDYVWVGTNRGLFKSKKSIP
ncbi:hypothetical protein [Pedobacter glucosidilyticus]|uniref:hypothetical protein n=1 Tax=Pedobacter glucosidilyticus TaxID=1122941 RepID=UPI00041278EB|nr:hypothetical protein [Pedobacter glucosidilyticus]